MFRTLRVLHKSPSTQALGVAEMWRIIRASILTPLSVIIPIFAGVLVLFPDLIFPFSGYFLLLYIVPFILITFGIEAIFALPIVLVMRRKQYLGLRHAIYFGIILSTFVIALAYTADLLRGYKSIPTLMQFQLLIWELLLPLLLAMVGGMWCASIFWAVGIRGNVWFEKSNT